MASPAANPGLGNNSAHAAMLLEFSSTGVLERFPNLGISDMD
jgi:hypothetical protein